MYLFSIYSLLSPNGIVAKYLRFDLIYIYDMYIHGGSQKLIALMIKIRQLQNGLDIALSS